MQVDDLLAFVRRPRPAPVKRVLDALAALLGDLVHIGLGYLSLDRSTSTLSGGESQRVRMVRHLGSALTDITYVFDEPTVGLHAHDVQRLNALLLRLRDKGNTVLVVEHEPETILVADHVIDVGPGVGHRGRARGLRGDRRAGCAARGRSPAGTWTGRGGRSGSRAPRPARCGSSTRGCTTSPTSPSRSRPGCSPSSPGSPARGRARWCSACCRGSTRTSSSSTRS